MSYLSDTEDRFKTDFARIGYDTLGYVLIKKSGEGSVFKFESDILDAVSFLLGSSLYEFIVSFIPGSWSRRELARLIIKSGIILVGERIFRKIAQNEKLFKSFTGLLYSLIKNILAMMSGYYIQNKIIDDLMM